MRLKHKLAFWLLKDSPSYETLHSIYIGGWAARQATRCFEFASKYFLDALKDRDAASLITQSFSICYGEQVEFTVVKCALGERLYNTPNPLFDRIRKLHDFVGKPGTIMVNMPEGWLDEKEK